MNEKIQFKHHPQEYCPVMGETYYQKDLLVDEAKLLETYQKNHNICVFVISDLGEKTPTYYKCELKDGISVPKKMSDFNFSAI